MRRALKWGLIAVLCGTGCRKPWQPTGSVDTACDLGAGACHVELGTGRALDLELKPRPPRGLEALNVEAHFTGSSASRVTMSVFSEQMDMGVTKWPLAASGDHFVATGQVPVCGVDRMRWVARLDFELEGVPLSRKFSFETRHQPGGVPDEGAAEPLDGPVVDFQLQSSDGPVRLSDFRGKLVLVYFGYTYCPDICPTSLAATARALKSLPAADLARVQTIFVSVDPDRDTPKHLAEYAHFFHPSILGLTGSTADVAIAARPFEVVYARHETTGGGSYVVDHSALTYLVAPDGHLAARLPHAARAPVVLAELAKWLPFAAPHP